MNLIAETSLLHRTVTGADKCTHYDNATLKKSYVKPGPPAKSTSNSNIHDAKVVFCIWWNQNVLLHYELRNCVKPLAENKTYQIKAGDWRRTFEVCD